MSRRYKSGWKEPIGIKNEPTRIKNEPIGIKNEPTRIKNEPIGIKNLHHMLCLPP